MFSHIMIGTDDLAASRRFYDATLGALGIPPGAVDDKGRVVYATPTGMFIITRPIDGQPATAANGGTIGFRANTPEAVHAWHAAGLANGGVACEDPPGLREGSYGKLHTGYLRDPAGNKICALHRLRA